MTSVTFPVAIGGDGSTVSDDDNATTGLRNGGWRTRFIPCFTNLVNIADYMVSYTAQTSTFAAPPPMGSTTPNTGAFTRLNLTGSTAPANGLFLPATNSLGFAVNSSEAMRLTATGLGIGTSSPGSKLTVVGSVSQSTAANGYDAYNASRASRSFCWGLDASGNYGVWDTTSGANNRLLIDSSGNLGLGVTPNSWFANAKVLELQGGSLWSSTTTNMFLMTNAYLNASASYIYKVTGAASYYAQSAGAHSWYNVASGTAGSTIGAWTQAMTLDASGNLIVGATSAADSSAIATFSGVSTVLLSASGSILRFNKTAGTDTGWLSNRSYSWHDGNGLALSTQTADPLRFGTNGSERARIDSSGRLLVGATSTLDTANNFQVVDGISAYAPNSQSFTSANAGACVFKVGRMTTTRSINASGTINASGADYAEYMVKAGEFTINKGDICGIDASGFLTNIFSDSITFVVKSTDPSYVGNDSWGAGIEDPEELESERQKVDRIAFAGQVPVNVLGATPGDYIIPVEDSESIKGEAVSNPTFEQYQKAVGKVIAIESDGRAKIIVKVS